MPNFPASGGGGNVQWENLAQKYVSVSGSNSNTGKGWNAALKNIYNGIEAILETGGTLCVGEGCAVGGPVTGQGIRLRHDNMPNDGYFFDAPGFLSLGAPIRIIGCGSQNGGNNFWTGVQANFTGGGSTFNPPIWIVGDLNMPTVVIEGLKVPNAVQRGHRVGVDWDRNLDGSIRQIAVANATRTSTTTVFTVTLPTAFTVTSASRTSNVTTLTCTNPGLPWNPTRQGVPVRVTTGHASFPAGDYVLTDNNNSLAENVAWSFSYADAGADVGATVIAGTLKTHGVGPGELIDLTTSNAHFLDTQYYANSVTIDTITVTDVFGDGNQNVNNIGTIAHQERFYCGTNNVQFRNCTVNIENFANTLGGNSWDFGHTQALMPTLEQCWYTGYVGTGETERDERRMASVYVYPGNTPNHGPGVASLMNRNCAGANGPIFLETGTNGVGVSHHIGPITIETSETGLGLPALRVWGNDYTAVEGSDIGNADAVSEFATVELRSIPPTGAQFFRCGLVSGPCVGGDNWQNPSFWVAPSRNEPTPWEKSQVTAWADGRITGKHPGAARAMGATGARIKNVIVDPSTWALGATQSRTLGQVAPDGSSTAVKIETGTQAYLDIKPNTTDGATWQVGGKFVVCGWINAVNTTAIIPAELFRVLPTGITFEEGESIPAPYTGIGWQFVSGYLTVATVSDSTPNYLVKVLCQSGSEFHFWGMTAFYVPTTVLDNDVFEFMGTVKHQPRYLLPGMTGTMEGGKLIAHGGLGIDTGITNVVGVGSGQLTLTGTGTIYEPRYDADGTTILGWVALLQATVNP